MKYMKKTRLILLLIAILCGFNVVSAVAQQTDYEKKVLEIKKKYVKIVMVKNGTWDPRRSELELSHADDYFLALRLAQAPFVLSSEQIESFGQEMAQAEKLKTAVDRQRENDREAEREQKRLEREKEEKKQEIERERQAYYKTDRGEIESGIKVAFEKWSKKGEFEKTSDYETRLQTQSKTTFDSICIAQVRKQLSYSLPYSTYRMLDALESNLSNYDSEKELYTIIYKLRDVNWKNQINVPIDKAQEFKSNWESFNHTVDDCDWSFVGNSLCPITITIEDKASVKEDWLQQGAGRMQIAIKTKGKERYRLPINLINQSEIIYFFDNLEINNPYLKGYVFNYSAKEHQAAVKRENEIRMADETYNRYSRFFKNRNEFDTFYRQGEEALVFEVEKRVVINNIANEFRGNDLNSSTITIKTANLNSYEGRYWFNNKFLPAIKKYDRKYDSAIIAFLINENGSLNKEWTKNGQFFKDKTDFFNAYASNAYKGDALNKEWDKNGQFFKDKIDFYKAYTSNNYKDILKSNKKQLKKK